MDMVGAMLGSLLLLLLASGAYASQFVPFANIRYTYGPQLRPSYLSSYSDLPYEPPEYGHSDGYGVPKEVSCYDTVTHMSTFTNYVTKTASHVKTLLKTKLITITAVQRLVETQSITETRVEVKTVTDFETKRETVTETETETAPFTKTQAVSNV
jgi:hypothetical protein